MRCRPETPKTKRCAVARIETMRCRCAAGLVLAFLLADIGRRVMSRPEVLAATAGTAVAVALIGLVALASIAAALKSLLSARSRGQPAGLGLLGLLVSLLALGLWVFAGAELLVALLSS